MGQNADTSTGGGPKSLRLLLEGESLLNDASSITLFTIFLSEVCLLPCTFTASIVRHALLPFAMEGSSSLCCLN